MKKLIYISLIVMGFAVIGNSQEYNVVDSAIVPLTEDTSRADKMIFDLWFFDGIVDSGLAVQYDIYKADKRVWLTTILVISHPDSGYVIRPSIWIAPEPDPYDVNGDGAVNWGDAFDMIMKLFRFR